MKKIYVDLVKESRWDRVNAERGFFRDFFFVGAVGAVFN